MFSITIFCLFFAVYKYKFLKVIPVAIQQVVDRISDSYIVIDVDMNIVDYNKTMEDTLKEIIEIKRGVYINDFTNEIVNNNNNFSYFIKRTINENRTFNFEIT